MNLDTVPYPKPAEAPLFLAFYPRAAGESLCCLAPQTVVLHSAYTQIPCQGPECTDSLNCPGHPDLAPTLYTLPSGLGSPSSQNPRPFQSCWAVTAPGFRDQPAMLYLSPLQVRHQPCCHPQFQTTSPSGAASLPLLPGTPRI